MNNLDELEDLLNQGEKNKKNEQKEYFETLAKNLGFENHNQKQRYDIWRRKNNLHTRSKDPDYIKGIKDWKENIDKYRTIRQKGRNKKEGQETLAKHLGFEDYNQKQRYDRWRKNNNFSTNYKDQNYIKDIEKWKKNIDCNRIIPQKGITAEERNKDLAKRLGFEDINQKARYDRWRKKNNLPVKYKDAEYIKGIKEWKENIDYNRTIYQKGRTEKESQEDLAKHLGFENYGQKQRYYKWRKKNNLSTNSKDPDYIKDIQNWKENIDKK